MSQFARLEPLLELDLMNRYVAPRTEAWRREGHLPWLLNASVSIGERSALLAAEWAHNQRTGHDAHTLRTLNLASEQATITWLEQALSPYAAVTSSLPGKLERSLKRVLQAVGVEPLLVVLDPFADGGVKIDALAQLLARRGRKTELLLELNVQSFERLAGRCTQEQIDEVLGTSLWRKLWDPASAPASLARLSVLYRSSLQRRGYAFARSLLLRGADGAAATSQFVFASRSRLGVALMSDLACRYRREHMGEPAKDIKELTRRIHELGGGLGGASTNRIVQGLSSELFGDFLIVEYRKALRELVRRGVIVRATASGITDDEILTFDGVSQMALFDSGLLAAS